MKYHQGKFIPKNPEKYVGNTTEIVFRSSWERKAMIFFDENPNVTKWASEEIIVPYISPLDGREHRYFPDFVIEVNDREGRTRKIMVEIKPHVQCSPPKQKKQTKRMITEMSTYMVNSAKWAAAVVFCNRVGMEFKILTEYELGVAKR